MSTAQQRALGDALVRMGLLTSGQLESMRALQRREGRPVSKQLVEGGFLTEERLVQVLGEQLGVETVDLSEVWVHERVRDMVLASVARRLLVLPMARRRVGDHDALLLAMVDPLDDEAVAVVSRRLPEDMRVVRLLAGEQDLLRAVDMIYGAEDDSGARPPTDDLQLSGGPESTLEDAEDDGDINAALADPLGDPPTIPTRADEQVSAATHAREEQATEAAVPIAARASRQEPATQPIAVDAHPPARPPRVVGAASSEGAADGPRSSKAPVVPGPKSGGGRPLPRAPATEVIRARGVRAPEVEPVVPGERRRRTMRDVTRRLGPAAPVPAAEAVAGPSADAAPLARSGPEPDPDILVTAVAPRVPGVLLLTAAISLVVILGVGITVIAVQPAVEPARPPGRVVAPEDGPSGGALAAAGALGQDRAAEPPDPPIAPLRPADPTEIAPGVMDGPAPPGHRFVLVDGLELRATAAADAEALLWLKAGQVVKVLATVEGAELVLVPPRGPAGFLSPESLGHRLPLAALARRMKFSNCVVPRGGIIDDCLYGARTQWEECRLPCRTGTRCAPACQAAFDACLTECRASQRSAQRRRRRR